MNDKYMYNATNIEVINYVDCIMILWSCYSIWGHYKYIDSPEYNNMGCIVKWGWYNLMFRLYECVYNWYSMSIQSIINLLMRLHSNKPRNDKYIYKFNKIWVNTNYWLIIS